MTRRDLTDRERDDFARIMGADRPVSPFDDPEWVARDNERWERRRQVDEEVLRGDGSPYVRQVREAIAAGEATGGEARTPTAAENKRSEEDG